MRINIYNIIKGLVMSDKASRLMQNKNQFLLRVHPQANKPQIKEALEKIFNTKVSDIRTLVKKGKLKRSFRTKVYRKSLKKYAFVSLKEGYSFDLAQQAGLQGVPERLSQND